MSSLKNIGIAVVTSGLFCVLTILIYSTSWEEDVDIVLLLFYVWVLLPYIVLLVSSFKIHRGASSDASRIGIFVSSLVVVIFSVLIYYDAFFVSSSSTSALVFIFVPGYSLVAIAVVYFASRFLVGLLKRGHKAP